MSFSNAAVPVQRINVPWCILHMVMQIESERLKPPLETLTEQCQTLYTEMKELVAQFKKVSATVETLLLEAEELKADTTPIWADDYNLCGDPQCDGDCRICQEGEYHGEEDYEEKYCYRRRK